MVWELHLEWVALAQRLANLHYLLMAFAQRLRKLMAFAQRLIKLMAFAQRLTKLMAIAKRLINFGYLSMALAQRRAVFH